MWRRSLIALVSLAVGAAGCVAGPAAELDDAVTTDVPADWAVRALPFGDGHDHRDRSHHEDLSTPNFRVVGYDPLLTDHKGNETAGSHYCGGATTTAEGRRLAIVHSFTTDVSFVVIDVTDPERPEKVGEYVLTNTQVWDATISTDGRHVLLATSQADAGPDDEGDEHAHPGHYARGEEGEPLRRDLTFTDACGATRSLAPEEGIPFSSGLILVGIDDPAAPVYQDFRPLPILGGHSIAAGEIEGRQVALASVTNGVHAMSYFQFYEIVRTASGATLAPLSTFQTPTSPRGGVPLINGHVDGEIQKHPLTGRTYAYLANWNAGMVVLDVTDPRAPVEVGAWDDDGNIHTTYPVPELWDGKHYTIVGQEFGGRPRDRPSGWIYLLDTTDPASPKEVSRWTLPADVLWDGESMLFTTHYVATVNRTLFVSAWHAGLWAVDLSDLASPRTAGVFAPNAASPAPPPPERPLAGGTRTLDWTPTIPDVLTYPDGSIVAFDGTAGVYMLRFDTTMPLPAVTEWPVG